VRFDDESLVIGQTRMQREVTLPCSPRVFQFFLRAFAFWEQPLRFGIRKAMRQGKKLRQRCKGPGRDNIISASFDTFEFPALNMHAPTKRKPLMRDLKEIDPPGSSLDKSHVHCANYRQNHSWQSGPRPQINPSATP